MEDDVKYVAAVTLGSQDALHYGMPRRSGRYPWGSGDRPYQHSGDFLSTYERMKASGAKDSEIATFMNINSQDLPIFVKAAKHERRRLDVKRVESLKADGKSNREIGRIMGIAESSVRSLLDPNTSERKDRAQEVAEKLKAELLEKRMLDVGRGSEAILGVSRECLMEAIYILENEDNFNLYPMGISTGKHKQSNTQILTLPEYEYQDVYKRQGDIQTPGDYYSPDNGKTFNKLERPSSLNSSRVYIRYAEDGGLEKDGVMEFRKNVPDLDMGGVHYAQVRVLVDDNKYMKGMAMYADDIPEGYDVVYNTNKKRGTDPSDVFKKAKSDPDNPFGAAIKANGQTYFIDPETGEKILSPVNKLKEEGDWNDMSKTLSSQFLSKQSKTLISQQLDQTFKNYEAELEEIKQINNPVLRKEFLKDFADDCDSATVHLKAAALPRQRTQVILPLTDMPDTQVYAPNFRTGEEVVLIRFPHGTIAEIPRLTVNNENKKAKSIMGQAKDAIGINPSVAGILSGADFDGDTVLVIPVNDKVKVNNKKPYAGLIGYEPKELYSLNTQIKAFEKKYPGIENKKEEVYIKKFKKEYGISLMASGSVQKEMGMISNLITDMTLMGADDKEIERAVKHSMTVIDANKHKLDYKQSYIDNDIDGLKRAYQYKGIDPETGKEKYGGAATLLSKRNQTIRVPERKGSGIIDKETGEVSYRESGRTYYDKKTGTYKQAQTEVKLFSTVKDFKDMSSGTIQEDLYAEYANNLRALANQARVEYVNTKTTAKNTESSKKYANEVSSLNTKLLVAKKNAPLERRANAMANSEVEAKKLDNPDMTKKEIGKARQIALTKARLIVGASAQKISISDSEWDAIQNNAISASKFTEILKYADADELRQRAMPKNYTISSTKQKLIKQLADKGYTSADIADQLNVSVSSVLKYSST